MSSVIRDKAQSLDSESLLKIWDEIAEWEQQGSLPMNSRLRAVVTEAMGKIPQMYAEDRPAGHDGLMCDFMAHEVWREIARRSLNMEGSQ